MIKSSVLEPAMHDVKRRKLLSDEEHALAAVERGRD
jgi:hypothetical protein